MRLGAGLSLATPDGRRWREVRAGSRSTGVAVRLDDTLGRIGLGLSFLDGRKVVDVSPQPASWVSCLHGSARAVHEPRTRWSDALNTGLRRVGVERGWWNYLPVHLDPELTAAAAAWPLLRPAIEAGADERCVPRWAAPLLAAGDVASGTRALLGARADRRVIREMANALAGPVKWWPIACAVALEQLDSGRIGDLLASSTQTYRCSQDEWLLLGRTLQMAPVAVVAQLLASADEADGPNRLLISLDGWQRLNVADRNVPNRVDRLERAIMAELEVPAPPPPVPQRPAPARRRPRPARRAPVRQPEARRPRRPDPVEEMIRRDDRPILPRPNPWRRLHRARRGSVDLILPAEPEQLTEWGQVLDNCLGAYVNAVRSGDVVIAGVRRDGRLMGAAQIEPYSGTILQLEGRQNRPLPTDVRAAVVAIVAEHGAR